MRELLGEDPDAAYRAQGLLLEGMAHLSPRIGRKVGLTSPVAQQQLGVDQPDFGVLLDDMRIPNNGTLRTSELITPRAEAEAAFILRSDVLDASREPVIDGVEYGMAATAGLEHPFLAKACFRFASNSRYLHACMPVSRVVPAVEPECSEDGARAHTDEGVE